MPDEPWAADIQRLFESVSDSHALTDHDVSKLEEANFSEDRLRGAFEEGFIDNDVFAGDRHDAREAFFEWMEYLGYDRADFDWDAWRDYLGY